ncbi:MAG TPA: hypothetical protein VK928_13895, partial [Longimicrobiales bacterium]|nr:hypothetical protein [Longimicrobiales bacterium]
MSATEPADTVVAPRTDATAPLRWPPPGLESLHGAAWRAVTPLAAGALVLTAPMLWAVARRTPFWSTGPWGSSWWLILVLTLLGVMLAIGGIARVVETLRDSARALNRGHNPRIVALIATDASNDSGFLLQGLRQYGTLELSERRVLIAARVVSAVGYTAALLWATIGLAIGLLLAARGIVPTGSSLAMFVLVPVALLLTPAFAARVLESTVTHRLRKKYRRDEDAERALRGDVKAWNDAAEDRLSIRPRTGSPLGVRIAAIALIAVAVVLPLPVLSVAVASSIGTALAEIAVPRYGRISLRHVRAEMLARYALPADPAITPQEAGEILHVIGNTGGRPPGDLEAPALRTLPPLPRGPGTNDMARFAGAAFEPRGPLTPEEIDVLEQFEAHPANAEYARLARAGAADANGARLDLAAVTTASPWNIPIPRFGTLRELSHHRIGLAVLQASRGQNAQAEQTLREVISVGVLVGREGTTLIES